MAQYSKWKKVKEKVLLAQFSKWKLENQNRMRRKRIIHRTRMKNRTAVLNAVRSLQCGANKSRNNVLIEIKYSLQCGFKKLTQLLRLELKKVERECEDIELFGMSASKLHSQTNVSFV